MRTALAYVRLLADLQSNKVVGNKLWYKLIWMKMIINMCVVSSVAWLLISCASPSSHDDEYFSDSNENRFFRQSKISWYSDHLRMMNEKPLMSLEESNDSSVYRFTLLPSFQRPLSVRLTGGGDGRGPFLSYVILNSTDDGGPGRIIKEDGMDVSQKEYLIFQKLFEELNFYSMHSDGKTLGLDGSEWILEAVVNGKYHAVVRWSPTYKANSRNTTQFVVVCEWLLNVAGIRNK